MEFLPNHIYIQANAENKPVTQRILQNPLLDGVESTTYNRRDELQELFLRAQGDNFNVNTARNILVGKDILCLKPGTNLVVLEKMHKDVVSMEIYHANGGKVYQLKLGGMCINSCHYCYLFTTYHMRPEVSVYVDTKAMKRGMQKVVDAADGSPVTFNAGEHSDSLQLDPITQLTTDIVPFIPTLPNTTLELRTKSAEVSNLEGLDHQGRTVIAWSIAPQLVVDAIEDGYTASFSERLEALKKCQSWGYKVALKLDPVIPIEGWEDAYSEMITQIADAINVDSFQHYSVGVLRMGSRLLNVIAELKPDSPLHELDLSEKRKGKITHPSELRRMIYLNVLGKMKTTFPDVPFYISMEEKKFANGILKEIETQLKSPDTSASTLSKTNNHKLIFGLTEDEMTEDDTGWLESDYQEARQLLYKIEISNPDQLKLFLEELKNLDSLDSLTTQQRCRFIYFLASQHVDWRDTNHQVVDGAATILYEKVYKGEPPIRIDFQHITDQVINFNPSAEQMEEWGKIFGNALKHHPVQGKVSSGIVRDAGKMRKRRPK